MNIKSQEFQLAIRDIKNGLPLYNCKNELVKFSFIKNPLLRWLADPFLFELDGKHYIFAESASRITGKGKLIYCEIDLNNIAKCKWKKCMDKKFHLSFPNVYVQNGSIFMLPETYQDNCLAKYVLKEKNDLSSWAKSTEIVSDKMLVDTVLFGDNYITYDISSEVYSLRLLSSNGDFLDQINDTKLSLRPAGKIFVDNDKTIFVSQNCKDLYGCGLFFNYLSVNKNKMEINAFCSIDFQDLNFIFNKKNFVGIHTYNFDSKFEIIDVRVEKFNIFGFLGKIFDKLNSKHQN